MVTESILKSAYYAGTGEFLDIPFYYETFNLKLSKFSGMSQSEWFSGSASSSPGYDLINLTTSVNLLESDNTLAFYMKSTDQPNLTITIEGKTYNNVVVTNYFNGASIDNAYYKKTIYYWAKGVGIIKRTTITMGGAVKTYTLLRNN